MVRPENLVLLTGPDATAEKVTAALAAIDLKAGIDGLVLVFFSGHGVVRAAGRDVGAGASAASEAYWVLHDTKLDRLARTGLSQTDISAKFAAMRTRRLVVIVDTCYSAATARVAGAGQPFSRPAAGSGLESRFEGDGHVLIASSGGDEVSTVINNSNDPGNGYSAFSWHVIQGLAGAADAEAGNKDGFTVIDELWVYVRDRTEETARRQGHVQRPILRGELRGSVVLAANPQRLVDLTARSHEAKEKAAARVDRLLRLLLDGHISRECYEQGRRLLESPADRLTDAELARRDVYADVTDAGLEREFLAALLPAAFAAPAVVKGGDGGGGLVKGGGGSSAEKAADPPADLSTPRGAALVFARAMRDGDIDALRSASVGNEEDYERLEVLFAAARAFRRLEQAAVARLGEAGRVPCLKHQLPDLSAAVAAVEIQVDGVSAKFLLTGAANAIRLKQVGGSWRLDLRSLDPKPFDEIKRHLPALHAARAAAERVVAQVQAGHVRTADDLRGSLASALLAFDAQ